MFEELLRRLRGGRRRSPVKRSPEEILRSCKRQTEFEEPQEFKIEFTDIQREEKNAEAFVPYVKDVINPDEEKFYGMFVLDIKDESDMNNYISKLKALKGFDKFRYNLSLNWLRTRLSRVEKILSDIDSRRDFDNEEFNSNLALKVRDLSRNMLDIYRDTESASQLDADSRRQLRELTENYLSSIGVEKKIFHVGDAFNDWADLGMENSHEQINTSERSLDSTLAEIKIQPHIIYYRGEFGETDSLIFGGICRVYKFKE